MQTKIDSKQDIASHKDRMKRLDWIESLLTELNAKIPNPTPDEIKWVEREQKEIGQIKDEAMTKDREGKLYTSIPYTEREAKTLINTGLSLAVKIKHATHTDEEMIYWTKLAIVIMDDSTLSAAFEALQKIFPEKIIRSSYFYVASLSSEGSLILSNIIIPYLCSISPRIGADSARCLQLRFSSPDEL